MRKALVPFLLALPLALFACGDDDDGGADDAATASEDEGGESGSGGAISVTASGFRFDPDAVEAAAGEATTIELTNGDDVDHTFTIEELDVDVAAGPGESASGEVTADAGEYEFVCRIHPNMTGTLTVS